VTQLGVFSLLPVLPVILKSRVTDSPGAAGALLFAFLVMYRGASIGVGGVLERVSSKRAVLAGLALTAACFVALGVVGANAYAAPLLVLSGVGMSINGVVGKAIVAESVEDAPARLRAFALLNVVLNAAAGIGPFVGTTLVGHVADRPLFAYIGGCYVLAVAVVAVGIEGRPAVRRGGSGVVDWRAYVGLFRERSLRFLIVTSAAVWFFYAQLFSGLPVHLFAHFGSRGLIASFFTLNAVLIIVLQYPLAAGLARRPSGTSSEGYMELLALGFVLFAGSFLLLGAAGAALAGVYAAVVLFTLAEMLSTPLLDTAFAHLGHSGRHVLSFNARKLAQVVGEGAGGFCGIALQNLFVHHGGESSYWWVLGAGALTTSAIVYAVNVTQVTSTASEP
jgi:MFS transporter, DHA1 family, multidrug resistance protein